MTWTSPLLWPSSTIPAAASAAWWSPGSPPCHGYSLHQPHYHPCRQPHTTWISQSLTSFPCSDTVALVRAAARSWGFFHVINHGVAAGTIDAAVAAVRAFHEQPLAERSALYSLAPNSVVTYSTNPHLPNQVDVPPLPWRDTLRVIFGSSPEESDDLGCLPAACQDALHNYQRSLTAFGKEMAGPLSEALGLRAERLEQVEGWLMGCHYYPPCLEPTRVVGGREHTDPSLFTVLLQDGVGGLQVRRNDEAGGEGEWVNVDLITGALVVNIGDVLKVVSNDEFKSVKHRVIIKSTEDARVSIALFLTQPTVASLTSLGPSRSWWQPRGQHGTRVLQSLNSRISEGNLVMANLQLNASRLAGTKSSAS